MEIVHIGAMRIITNLIRILTSIAEFFLGLRFLLRLFNANAGAPFVKWIYDTSDSLLYPFRGIFPNQILSGGHVFEITTLFAIMAYAVLSAVVIAFLWWLHNTTVHHTAYADHGPIIHKKKDRVRVTEER